MKTHIRACFSSGGIFCFKYDEQAFENLKHDILMDINNGHTLETLSGHEYTFNTSRIDAITLSTEELRRSEVLVGKFFQDETNKFGQEIYGAGNEIPE